MRFPALVWLFQVYFRMKAAWQKQLGVDLQNSPGSWQSLWSPLAKIYIFFWEWQLKNYGGELMACIPPSNFFKAPIGAFLGVLQNSQWLVTAQETYFCTRSLLTQLSVQFALSHHLRVINSLMAPWLHPGSNPGCRKAAEARQNDLDRKLQQKDLDRERMRGGNWWDKKLLVFFSKKSR